MKNPGGGIKRKYSSTLDDLVKVIGLPAMLYLARSYGGRAMRIPSQATPDSPLTIAIGTMAASQLCAQYRGDYVDIPAESTVMLQYEKQIAEMSAGLHARLTVRPGESITLQAEDAALIRDMFWRHIQTTAEIPALEAFLSIRRADLLDFRNQLIRQEVAAGEAILRVALRYKLSRKMIRKIIAPRRTVPLCQTTPAE